VHGACQVIILQSRTKKNEMHKRAKFTRQTENANMTLSLSSLSSRQQQHRCEADNSIEQFSQLKKTQTAHYEPLVQYRVPHIVHHQVYTFLLNGTKQERYKYTWRILALQK
jgi:hypothetical protein